MINLGSFLSENQSMIIAPAGYGKTHTIAECVNLDLSSKICLILTHTHAGIASLKEKLQSIKTRNNKYELATICGFSLHMAQSYHLKKEDFPNIEEAPNEYYRFAIESTIKLLKAKPIHTALKIKYSHIIIDEYQDCSILQHQLIKALSMYIPTHILGDPLQSIFKFDGECVDMNSIAQMGRFIDNKQILEIPWRWKKHNSDGLGEDLKAIRQKIENKENINIDIYKNINVLYSEPEAIYKHGSLYNKLLWTEIANNNSLLIIHPKSESKNFRIKIIKSYPRLRLIEAVDDKDFYFYSSAFDNATKQTIIPLILKFCRIVFKKTIIDNWFNNSDNLKSKRRIEDQVISNSIKKYLQNLENNLIPIHIYNLIYYLHHLPTNECCRSELVSDMYKALRKAQIDNISISEAIKYNREVLRQVGRKVEGKCIGTTLLTKGLEFDTVIVLNFQDFEDKNNFYVAITRACKKLILVGNTHQIYFK